MDGNDSYNAYDYQRTNCMLIFGAGFLESFRPYKICRPGATSGPRARRPK